MIRPPLPRPHFGCLRSERGFTLIIALGVMFVTSLLLVAAFTVANGEISTTRRDTTNKQAYYAALAGLQEYEYRLQANPDYWQTCEGPKNTVPEEKSESYEVEVLPASTAPKGTTACVSSNPFATVIESGGSLANTFRIKSTGFAGTSPNGHSWPPSRVDGLPRLHLLHQLRNRGSCSLLQRPACAGKYYSEWSAKKLGCEVITFISGDEVNGPMHTNDATRVEGTASFGRKGHSPRCRGNRRGHLPQDSGQKCTGGEPKFYTATSCYTKGATLIPPESDTSLTAYVKKADEFEGLTRLVLNGSANTITVVNYNENEEKVESTISWPENGLIYVKARTCGYNYEPDGSDDPAEAEEEKGCGNVYVSGTYSKSLTVAGEGDVIINGNIYPTNLAGKLGNEPTGTATLG